MSLFLYSVRVVIFAIVWLLTWGKLSFWLLPNLTEDVGFFDSFRPAYQCTFAQSEPGDGDATAGSCIADEGLALGENASGEEEKSGDHMEELELENDVDENEDEEDDDNNDAEEDIGDDDIENDNDDDEIDNDEEHSVASNDNGYEVISAEDVENGDRGDIAAEDEKDADDEESRPNVRRRKGKRRIT